MQHVGVNREQRQPLPGLACLVEHEIGILERLAHAAFRRKIAAAGILIGLWWHPLGLAAAAGMALLLLGAIITHRKAADSAKEMTPALLALLLTLAYLTIALTS